MTKTKNNGIGRYILIGLLLASMLVTASVLFLLVRNAVRQPEPIQIEGVTAQTASGEGTLLDPPRVLDDFTMLNTEGETTSLSDFSSGYTLMYFGYTHCPDVCPLTLLDFKRVKAALPEDSPVNYIMVSVDGERDTPELLGRYISRFDEDFVGLTESQENIDALEDFFLEQFNVFFERRIIEGTAASYLVDHTASMYLVGPGQQLIAIFPFGANPEGVAQDIEALL